MYQVPSQRGKLAVVTGANSGTGREAALRLAEAGAEVILAVRNTAKGNQARDEIRAAHPNADVQVRELDLADLTSVRTFADALIKEARPLDLLLNNAGVMNVPQRMVTADGFELQFGSNFLGPYVLTIRLLPLLLSAPAARVATMSSLTANRARINFEDLQSSSDYSPTRAYAQSKLADMLLTPHLAHLAERNRWPLMSTGAHPGFTRTNLMISGPNLDGGQPSLLERVAYRIVPLQGPEQGAEPLLFAATSPDAVNGGYYGPRWSMFGPTKPVALPQPGRDRATAERLWDVAAALTGEILPVGPVS